MTRWRRRLRVIGAGLALAGLSLIAVGALWPSLALELEFARLRWLATASEHVIEVDAQRVVHLEAGSGPPLVLLHGFTGSKENWLLLIPHLSARHRVFAPDLPGWGESTRDPGADYGYAAQAERLAAWLTALKLGPVDLVGHSMGGGIAAVLAARHPELVRRLVLMDAGGVRFRENAFARAVLEGANPFAVHDRASLDRYLGTVFDRPPFVPWPADRALIARRIADSDFESEVLQRVGRGDEVFLPEQAAAQIRQPTLLLWCRADQVIDASAAAAYLAAIGAARSVLLDGCNHMPMMEQPESTAQVLEDFLP
jgi:pimeloyl-ACP methyl ester carboxylesterase